MRSAKEVFTLDGRRSQAVISSHSCIFLLLVGAQWEKPHTMGVLKQLTTTPLWIAKVLSPQSRLLQTDGALETL